MKVESNNLIRDRDRVVRLFTYLKELARLSTKVTRDISSYDEVLWFSEIPNYKGCSSFLFSQEKEISEESNWLEVQKQVEPKSPPPPSICVEWIEQDSNKDPLIEPHLRKEMSDIGSLSENHRTIIELARVKQLVDYPELVEEWQKYLHQSWLPWAEVYCRWKSSDQA